MPRKSIYLTESEVETVDEHAEDIGSRSGVLRKALQFWAEYSEDDKQHVCWECERVFRAADDTEFCPYCAGTQTAPTTEEVDA